MRTSLFLQCPILARVGRAQKEAVRWKIEAFVPINHSCIIHFTHCMTLGKSPHRSGFLICKTGIKLEPTLQGCCED